ncbi:MAG: lamin tail domain-containing protein [Candidatus Staskawiczbacteria bacterium]|nr:lamin tail domain-containing protein [Candidatus Staskawiczbacteria bacterium]
MNEKRVLIILVFSFLAIVGMFFASFHAKAYGRPSHSILTTQTAELYNKIYEPNLTESQIQKLVQGSFDEDTAPRWINHFYDPISRREWLGKRLGNLPEEQVRQISKIVFGKDPVSTLNWAHNQSLQDASYRLYQGNRTFESAVSFYLDDNKDNAYYNLGHILHLIEDMSVPAHTRQDSHFDMSVPKEFEQLTGITFDKGEPYENWALNYTNQNQDLNLTDNLKNNYQPICSSLDDCLTVVAQYSNNNFFSSDSILDKEYTLPNVSYSKNVVEDGRIVKYYYSESNYLLGKSILEKQNFSRLRISYPEIHQAYWDNLAPKAILAGVEVIKYFNDEVEKAKNEEITIEKPPKPNFLTLLKGISLWGEIAKAGKFLGEKRDEFIARLNEAWEELTLSINDFWNKLLSFNPFLAFSPPTFSVEETIFSEKIEPPPDPFSKEDPGDKTDEIITGIVEYVTGTGGPNLNFDFQNQQDLEDALDDITEKLDILRQQALGLIEEYNSKKDNLDQNPEDEDENGQTQQQNNLPTATSGGGRSNPVYSKILISEVQVAGLTDEKEEFVELYNPNTSEIDLTGWYLQKKTKTGFSYSTYAPNTSFSGKKIGASSYFIIARENSSFVSLADIVVDNSLTKDNSLILKNPNGETSDKLGFGQAQEYETISAVNPENGQSIGRKWNVVNNIEQDTDNNSIDFETQNPTPRAKNSTFIVSPDTPPLTPTDTTAPEVSFNLGAKQTSLTFMINFDITDSATFVSPSGIDNYVFRWKAEGDTWQEDNPAVVAGNPVSVTISREFTGQDETTYYFQVKAKDVAGNESDWQPETATETKISIFKKVLINEIQIDSVVGTGGASDDWVELYNPNNVVVSLDGWSIQKHSSDDPCSTSVSFDKKNFPSEAVIPAQGFFFIVRAEAQESLKAIADMTISWSLSEDNTIYLVKNQYQIEGGDDLDIVDKVGFGLACFPETSPAPNPPEANSIERKKLGQDTDNNSEDFRISGEPTYKTGSPKAHIWDGTGNVAESNPPDYSNTRSSSNSVRYYDVKIKWDSNSPNLDFYDVQYKVNEGDWQDWIIQTTDTEKVYRAYDSMLTDYVYRFRARAQDKEGNQGDWSEITIDVTNPVVINEVAFWGTNASKEDQWIELYNRSEEPVDLTGWRALLHDGLYHEFQGTIPAKGYLVFETKNDDNISDISADQILIGYISGRIPLINQNNRQMDEFYLPSHQGCYCWFESDFLKEDGNYYSMERISPYAFGNDSTNWKLNNGNTINGNDRNGELVYGTPGQQNSYYQAYTPLSSNFAEDTILSLSLSPYLMHSGSVSIYENKTLTIEPGVVVKFYDGYGYAGLRIDGALKAVGTPDQNIIFTSFFDDQYGGDSNGDGDQSSASPGSWMGLHFSSNATGLSELAYNVLRYGGNPSADSFGAGIRVDQIAISLVNSIIEKNANKGLWLTNSTSIIDSNQFTNQDSVGYKGIYMQGGNPQIKNSNILNNYYGLYVERWLDVDNTEFWTNFFLSSNNIINNIWADIWDIDNPPPPPTP